jgi:hypothetical protein
VAGPGGEHVFEDVTAEVFPMELLDTSVAHSAGFLDFDNDGDLDLYVVNEDMRGRDPLLTGDNLLWRNDGPDGNGAWRFTKTVRASGAFLQRSPMGLAIGDYNNDGWWDLAMSDLGPNYLFRNEGGRFVEVGAQAGIDRGFAPNGDIQVGWGLVFLPGGAGWEDLYVATGGLVQPETQPNPLFLNLGDPPDNAFLTLQEESGCSDPSRSRTVIKADYDQDGDEDLYVMNFTDQARLYRNDQQMDFLALKLVGTVSNRDAIGARVKVEAAGLPDQYRMVQSGSTTGGGNELTLYFGLNGAIQVDAITIDWPRGIQQILLDVPLNQRLFVTEKARATLR